MATQSQIALEFIEGFNTHRDFTRWSSFLADGFTGQYPGAPLLNGEQAVMYNSVFLPAFPDLHFDVHQVVTQGDTVVIHWTATGTHKGPLMTMSGQSIPATGRKGVVSGVLISEVRDGKILREYSYWDQVSLLTQLGLMPAA